MPASVQLTGLSATIQASAAKTANNTSSIATMLSASHDLKLIRGLIAYVIVTAASGTSPSMTVKLQDSPDGVNFADTGAATAAITGTGVYRMSLQMNVGPYVQAVSTITGTTPSFTYSIVIVGTP